MGASRLATDRGDPIHTLALPWSGRFAAGAVGGGAAGRHRAAATERRAVTSARPSFKRVGPGSAGRRAGDDGGSERGAIRRTRLPSCTSSRP